MVSSFEQQPGPSPADELVAEANPSAVPLPTAGRHRSPGVHPSAQPTLRPSLIARKAVVGRHGAKGHPCTGPRRLVRVLDGRGAGQTPADAVRCERGDLYPGSEGTILNGLDGQWAVLAAKLSDDR